MAKAHVKLSTLIKDPSNSKSVVKAAKGSKKALKVVTPEAPLPLVSNIEENIADDNNHTKTAKKIYFQVRDKINVLLDYFRIPIDNSGIIINRTINDTYSTIKVKFLYSHKKLMFVVFNDKCEVGQYSRTTDIIKNIDQPYSLDKDIENLSIEEINHFQNFINDYLFWGMKVDPSKERFNRAFAVTLNKQNELLENRNFHTLYYGMIVNYKLVEEKDDEFTYEMKFLHNETDTFTFTLTKDNHYKIGEGQIFIANYANKMNIFNFKGIKSLVDFSSLDYKNLLRHNNFLTQG